MPMNRIQFQQGMSLPEFMASFGTEEQCAEAVRQALTLEAVGQWAQAALMPGARVVSDGLGFDLRGLVARLIIDVLRCKPRAQRIVRGNTEDRCQSGGAFTLHC
jgi:hypothetical protein